jgi:hypothetical protein
MGRILSSKEPTLRVRVIQKAPERWFCKKLQMQGARKLRREAYFRVRCNDDVEAQSGSERDRWTFYETIMGEAI